MIQDFDDIIDKGTHVGSHFAGCCKSNQESFAFVLLLTFNVDITDILLKFFQQSQHAILTS